jgi:hypothetical protein
MTTTQSPISTATTPAAAIPFTARPLSILSLIAGIVAIVFGQTFFVPLAAVVLGVLGYRQESTGRAFAVWGIVLGGLALFGWLIFAFVGLAFAAPFLWFAAF